MSLSLLNMFCLVAEKTKEGEMIMLKYRCSWRAVNHDMNVTVIFFIIINIGIEDF